MPGVTETPVAGQLLIGGRWVPAAGGDVRESRNPATGETLGSVAEAGQADVGAAVQAAAQAFSGSGWAEMTPSARGELLWRLADLVERELAQLAETETRDEGLPLSVQQAFAIPNSVQTLRYYAGWCTKISGVATPLSIPGVLHHTARVPVGVCGLITPWNAPLMIAVWKLAPALATGNTVVIKPAPQTPFTTLRLGALVQQAGFPAGVVNIVTGGDEAGEALVRHPGVAKVGFTGSSEAGRSVMVAAAERFARVSLELGNKGPNIIAADADLDAAIDGSLVGAFLNSGQICAAYARFYVHRSRIDELTHKLAAAASKMIIGNGLDPDSQLGPLVSQDQLDRVDHYVSAGRAAGATVVTGGGRACGAGLDDGFFYEPTVFADVTDDMVIAREEIFGPVVTVMPFDDEDEVIARGNALDYGLSAAVWSRDIGLANRLAQGLRYGTVWINLPPFQDAAAPWGGFGASGIGREMGWPAIEAYTEIKGVWTALG